MTPTNPTDDFDFDDLPDLPLLEDEDSSGPDTTQEPVAVAQSEEDDGADLPELVELDLPEVSATPSIESAQSESDEAVPVAEAEPDVEPEIAEDEQHVGAVLEDVVHEVEAVSLATDEETFSDVELAEFEPASQAEQLPAYEPADEVPVVVEDPSQAQPDAAFVQDPEQAQSPPHSAARSCKPLIIGGAVAAVLAIGTAVLLFWPTAEPQTPVQASASAAGSPGADPSTPAPTVEPIREFTAADLVSDVLSDQPQFEPTPEKVVQPSAPVEPTPAVQATAPAVKSEPAPTLTPTPAAKPAAVVAKPASAPAPAKPAKKPAPQKTDPAKEQDNKWQDEALKALDAFEKGL